MLEPSPNPATLPAPASYHWTPALQGEFLGHLAAMGSVRGAALFVQMSARAAYDLRDRREGLAFRLGWAAAILVARDRLQDELLDRAFTGTLDTYERISMGEPGAYQIRRRRINPQASMAMLERLDRQVAERATSPEAQLARIIVRDFAAYLDLFTTDAFAAEPAAALGQWFADQRARPDPLAALLPPPATACEVAQISADQDLALTDDERAEQAVAALDMWWDDDSDRWLTNFPPPPEFDGDEAGDFGDDDYWRELAEDEQAVLDADAARDVALMLPIADERRRAFFGLDDAPSLAATH